MSKKQHRVPLTAAELKQLAKAAIQKAGKPCQVCISPARDAIDQCLREGVSIVGLSRVLVDKGYAEITDHKLARHRSHRHHLGK